MPDADTHMDPATLPRHASLHSIHSWLHFILTGVHIRYLRDDHREAEVSLIPRWFGRGDEYQLRDRAVTMMDSCFALVLRKALGDCYSVRKWRTRIEYFRICPGMVTAHLRIPQEIMESLLNNADGATTYYPEFSVNAVDADNDVIASLHLTLCVRRSPSSSSEHR